MIAKTAMMMMMANLTADSEKAVQKHYERNRYVIKSEWEFDSFAITNLFPFGLLCVQFDTKITIENET